MTRFGLSLLCLQKMTYDLTTTPVIVSCQEFSVHVCLSKTN
jgi:hypothetical protein